MDSQEVCCIECSLALVAARKRERIVKDARKRKRELKPLSWFLSNAQREFNAYIRLRDAGLPCVSCGRMHEGQWHAGHYRPVGGQGAALRFNEINCHRQCSVCNNHHSGQLTGYRENLIHRIGIELVEWLEKDHGRVKWSRDELDAIRLYYKRAKKYCTSVSRREKMY